MYKQKYEKYVKKISFIVGGNIEKIKEEFKIKFIEKHNLKSLDIVQFKKPIGGKINLYLVFKDENELQKIKDIYNKYDMMLYYDTLFDTYGISHICEISNMHLLKILELFKIQPTSIIPLESFPIVIKSQRCTIRPTQKTDYKSLLPVWTDSDNIKQHGVIWTNEQVKSICDTTAPLQKYSNGDFCRRSNGGYSDNVVRSDLFTGVYFTIEVNNEIIGCLVLNKLSDELNNQLIKFGENPNINHSIDIGYAYNKKFHGMGYATEVLNAVCNFIKENNGALQIHSIYGDAIEHNVGSQKVMEKVGYIKIGEGPFLYMKNKRGVYLKLITSS